MKPLIFVVFTLAWATSAGAANSASLGYSDQTTIIEDGSDSCVGPLVYNHDGTLENGFAWAYAGVVPPYYGAFGEGFAAEGGCQWVVLCAELWVTTLPGYYEGQTCDVYVWSGGASDPPGEVLAVVTGIVLDNVPIWPSIGANEVEIFASSPADAFTVGYWGAWPDARPGYYIAADIDGPGGHPWTYIAPGIGYPTGWNDPAVVWGPVQSLGLGVVEGAATPAAPAAWGEIKALFR